jgi:hypothetical protein
MTTLTLQKQTDIVISDEISDRDLLNLCIANPSLSICRDDNFWRERLFRKYGNVQKSDEKTWKTFYLQLLYYMDKSDNNANKAMRLAAKGGHRDLVDLFIQRGANDWNLGMYGAAEGGHRDLVDFFIQRGATDWNSGMARAAEGGHRDLVEFFIQKGADDWVLGMECAALEGHRDLVKFFKEKMNR